MIFHIKKINFLRIILIYIRYVKNLETLLYSAVVTVLTVIQTLLMTKYLEQKDYGYYGYYVSLSQFVMILTNWGFTSWAVNEIGEKSNLFISNTLNKIIASKVLIGGCSLIALLSYIFVVSGRVDAVLIIAFLAYYLSIVFSMEVLYISISNINKMVRISMYTKFIFTLIFCVVLVFMNFSPQLLFMLFAMQSVANSLFLYLSQNDFKVEFNFKGIRRISLVLDSSPNFMVIFSSFLFASGPVILSGHFLSKEAFAIVYASTAIVKMIQASYQPLINKILPKLNLGYSVKNDVRMAFLFAVLATISLFVLAPLIVELIFNNKFTGLVSAIRILSLSILPGLMSTIIISQWAVYSNKLHSMYGIVSLLTVMIFGLFFLLSRQLSWQVVIWTMLVSEVILLLILLVVRQQKVSAVWYGI